MAGVAALGLVAALALRGLWRRGASRSDPCRRRPGTLSAAMDKRDAAGCFAAADLALDRLRISRAELCRRIGIDRPTLAQLMADDPRACRADTVAALATGCRSARTGCWA